MKKIILFISKVPKDKLLHFIGGLLISQCVFAILVHFIPMLLAFLVSCIFTAIMAGIKEWWDVKHGTPEWKDFFAGMIGSIFGLVILYVTIL